MRLEALNALKDQFANDTDERKISLTSGVYRTELGEPFVLPAVKLVRFPNSERRTRYVLKFAFCRHGNGCLITSIGIMNIRLLT